MSIRVTPYLNEDDVTRLIYALKSSKGDQGPSREDLRLAARLGTELEQARESAKLAAETEAAIAAERAKRAAEAILTKRQAECMAAIRAGKGPFYKLADYGSHKRWQHARHMGGAVRRMVDALIEEGLLTKHRALTPEGTIRLDAWEAQHGEIKETA